MDIKEDCPAVPHDVRVWVAHATLHGITVNSSLAYILSLRGTHYSRNERELYHTLSIETITDTIWWFIYPIREMFQSTKSWSWMARFRSSLWLHRQIIFGPCMCIGQTVHSQPSASANTVLHPSGGPASGGKANAGRLWFSPFVHKHVSARVWCVTHSHVCHIAERLRGKYVTK